MSDRFDEITRILASELPRREALKLAARALMGGVVVLAVPGGPLRPTIAWARGAALDGAEMQDLHIDVAQICPRCGPASVEGDRATQLLFGPITDVTLTRAVNVTVTVTPRDGVPVPIEEGETVEFDPPAEDVTVIATKRNPARKAIVVISPCNRTGVIPCCEICDPVDVALSAGERWGSMKILTRVPELESKVTVYNHTPGLSALALVVNGRRFRLSGLRDGEQLTVDLASAMQPGDTNEFVLRAEGQRGSSARILIWDGGSPQRELDALRHGRVGLLSASR
jgi:hypothetical protein